MKKMKSKLSEAVNRVITLEYILEHTEVPRRELQGDQKNQYSVGDIIMAPRFYSKSSNSVVTKPHRILIITSKKIDKDTIRYEGFELSSNISKSNKNGRYPHSLHIEDYSTILRNGKSINKPAILIVNDLVSFKNTDLSTSGSYKGHVTDEFLKFVMTAYNNYKSGKDNSQMHWVK